jgi:hypothetical protein
MRENYSNERAVDGHPKTKPRKPKWPWFVSGFAVLLGLVIAIAGVVSGQQPSNTATAAPAPQTVTQTVTEPAPTQAVKTVTASPQTVTKTVTKTMTKTVPAPAEEQSPASGGVGDGTYMVGTDIKPGTYHTTGAVGGSLGNCYFARLSSTNTSDIIDNNNSTGPMTVTIASSDAAFETSGCESWVKR